MFYTPRFGSPDIRDHHKLHFGNCADMHFDVLAKKDTKKKIPFNDLSDHQMFDASLNERKFFLDTIKVIAYRAETAMCNTIKKEISTPEQELSIIRKLYSADANIETDLLNKILLVKIHNTNHWADDKLSNSFATI